MNYNQKNRQQATNKYINLIYIDMNTKPVGVYKLHKLGRLEGKFNKDQRILERPNHVVTTAYANQINSKSEINGLHYEFDEAATQEYYANAVAGSPENQIAAQTPTGATKPEAGANGDPNAGGNPEPPKMTDEERSAEVKRLGDEYFKLTQKEPKQSWGIPKLTSEIAAINAAQTNQ